ncbi:hypothetical protein [Microbacterium testaceum]|uniref:hypothetical protein n=1 Tax=Microbacterium testaceum TaxID=2033 RepID=UPI001056FDA5|nr:hypothetical protein [Microbacterium testaceum]
MAKWFSLETPAEVERFTAAWGSHDAPTDELGGFLLEIAREQVIEYAPAGSVGWPADGGAYKEPSSALVYAQLQQARNLWNAGQAGSDGAIGTEGYSFTPRPLDKTIRSIIRPSKGVPSVF